VDLLSFEDGRHYRDQRAEGKLTRFAVDRQVS
jgi:hypothetical protein